MKKDSQSIIDVFCKIGIFSLSLFVTAFAVYIYSPIVGSHADENSKDTEITLTVNSRLGLRVNTELVNLSGVMDSFVHDSVNVDVATNSLYGYTLALEDADDDTKMNPTTSGVSSYVSSNFSGVETSSTMDENTWGYSLDESSYYSIPQVNSPAALKKKNGRVESEYETTQVTFGVKIGHNLTAGDYVDVIKFTAYTNGVDGGPEDGTDPDDPGRKKDDEGKMQSFNCSSLATDGVRTLVDKRDGNEYTIAKLADDRCWMTENLRIKNKTISNEDSDVYDKTFTIPDSNWSTNYNEAAKRDNPYIYDTGTREHGVYYNYAAASAGTITGASNLNEATQSICPSGWTLPSQADYAALYSAAGVTADADGAQILLSEPISFKLSGNIYYSNSDVQNRGTLGIYWSSTANSANAAQRITPYTNATTNATTSGAARTGGFPIRCVAQSEYKVKWDLGGGTANSNSVQYPSKLPSSKNINLSTYAPKKDGYEFDGWSSSESTNYTGSETSVNINPDNKSVVKLTAKWLKVDVAQNFSCSKYSPTETGKVRDTRDGNIYNIARLEDGRCWMTENLRIKGKTLTSTDTDIPSGTFTLPNSNWLDGVTNTWRDTDLKAKNPYVYDSGNKDYGVYYNGDAAYAVNGSVPIQADQSICPKGWTLPTTGEYVALYNAIYNKFGEYSMEFKNYIANDSIKMKLAGLIEYRASSPKWIGESAHFWASKSNNTGSNYSGTRIFSLYNGVQSNSSDTMAYISGISIRCIARQ